MHDDSSNQLTAAKKFDRLEDIDERIQAKSVSDL